MTSVLLSLTFFNPWSANSRILIVIKNQSREYILVTNFEIEVSINKYWFIRAIDQLYEVARTILSCFFSLAKNGRSLVIENCSLLLKHSFAIKDVKSTRTLTFKRDFLRRSVLEDCLIGRGLQNTDAHRHILDTNKWKFHFRKINI